MSADSITTNGVLYIDSGGIFNNAKNTPNTQPNATWHNNSTCIYSGIIDSTTVPTNFGSQTYGNLTWNCTRQTSTMILEANLPTVNGIFRIQNTNSGALVLANGTTGRSWTTVNSLEINDGATFYISGRGATGAVTYSMTVNNFNQTGGTFNICRNSTSTSGSRTYSFIVNGDATISGDDEDMDYETCPHDRSVTYFFLEDPR